MSVYSCSSFENGSGSLKIKNISDSPEIRNLSDQEAKEVLLRGQQHSDLDGPDHGSTNSVSPPATAIMLPQQPVPMAAAMAALAASNSTNTTSAAANSVSSKEDGKSSKSASTNHSCTSSFSVSFHYFFGMENY